MMNRWKRIVLAVMIVMAAVCLSSCQESREKQYQEAMNKAEESGANLVLADRNIQTTFKRTWRKLTAKDKIRLLNVIVSNS